MKFLSRSMLMVCIAVCSWSSHAAALTQDQQNLHVLNRIAFGPKSGDIQRVREMGIQRYIEEQLKPETIAMPVDLTDRLAALDVVNAPAGTVLSEFIAAREAAKDGNETDKQHLREVTNRINQQTAEARLIRAIDSPRQLEEVMVDFWFNHFNVFVGKGIDRALIASYERDAIRPYVMGSFRDLLGATAKHPAMLFYLDNWLSTADQTEKPTANGMPKKGKRGGLNENYARELMELHTLGVDDGYTQSDVTELARILTGWTFNQRELMETNRSFRFEAKRHDNGDKQWLGQRIVAQGQIEGEQALDILAQHPATAKHLAFKFAQYFVGDTPPPALVKQLAQRYLQTGGNIREVLRTLLYSQEFMAAANVSNKFKTPYQYVISAARASQIPVTNTRPLVQALNQLGMPLYGCQTPDGYKNTQDAWLNPDALTRRITFANALASGRLPLSQNPVSENMSVMQLKPAALDASILFEAIGPGMSNKTREIIFSNPDNLRAAMVLGSPDFMQR